MPRGTPYPRSCTGFNSSFSSSENRRPYTEGPFAGTVSPLGSLEDLTRSSSEALTQPLADLRIEDPPLRKPLTNLAFQNLIEARHRHSAAPRPPRSGTTPVLVETAAAERCGGILKDVFFGAGRTPQELESSASIRDRMNADERFSDLGDLISTFCGQMAMDLVRNFLRTQPDETQGDLCEALVRDIIQEIPPTIQFDRWREEGRAEGKMICAALRILIEKDHVLGDDTTRFRDLMLKLELLSRKHGINYRQE